MNYPAREKTRGITPRSRREPPETACVNVGRPASVGVGVTGVIARERMLREEHASEGVHAGQSLLPGVSARHKSEVICGQRLPEPAALSGALPALAPAAIIARTLARRSTTRLRFFWNLALSPFF